ncbi:MAG: tetratricopeptide repeat protein [Candidatus Obscuribacterales bacterium]|nr:tetratricopeptide repeat protein [Candidatus Obscuribacterales bacterium]
MCYSKCAEKCGHGQKNNHQESLDRRSLPIPSTPWQQEALNHLNVASHFARRLKSDASAKKALTAYLAVARFALERADALDSKLGVHLLVLESQLAEAMRQFSKEARLNKQALALARTVYDDTHPWTGLAMFNRAEDFLEEARTEIALGMLEKVVAIMSSPQSVMGDFTPEYLAFLRNAASAQIDNATAPLA